MIKTNQFTLPNGLRVIHNFDSATAMVALNVLYDVGARDESDDMTGLAHLFEHLMFGGSVNIPDFDAAIEQAGGLNNAWTSSDFTNFYDVVPAQNAEVAFWLESDRMLGLAFSDKALEVQRHVVIEEFKQTCLNEPYGDMSHHLRALIYKQHPYRYPVIGKEISHIEKVTQQDVKDFYYSHYAPNNAVVAVSGNITLEETRFLAEKWMGDIPSRNISKRKIMPEPLPTEARRATVYGRVPQVKIVKAFPMPGYGGGDYVACDMITDLLASGNSSRFYRNLLLGTDVFTKVDASISGLEDCGYLMLTATLRNNSDTDIERAEELILGEARKLACCGEISEYEIERVKNRFESASIHSQMGYLAKAQSMAVAVLHKEDVNDAVPRYRSVKIDDIERVADKILNPDYSSTLIYRPE